MSSIGAQIHLAQDLTTGRLIGADRAEPRPGKGRYRCLDDHCKQDLTVARSKRGRMHFRHFRNADAKACVFHSCAGNRRMHTAAQALLRVLLQAAIERRAPMPLLAFETPAQVVTVLPFITGTRVVTEWLCPLKHRRADVAILDRFNEPVLLIEVFHTHAVDHKKRLDLTPYWWIEVGASDVLEEPLRLNVRDHGNLPYDLEILGHQNELFDRVIQQFQFR